MFVALAAVAVGVSVYQVITSEKAIAAQYTDALAAAERQDWDQAVAGFQAVVRARPDYKDVATRLANAKQEQHRSQLYIVAMEGYRALDWAQAVSQLEALAGEAPNYKDVTARLADARYELRQVQLHQRYDAAMDKYRAGAWSDAVQQLQAINPDEPTFLDVGARLTDARHQLDLQNRMMTARAGLQARKFAAAIPAVAEVCNSDYSDRVQACDELARAHRDFAIELVRQADLHTGRSNGTPQRAWRCRHWSKTRTSLVASGTWVGPC